MRREKRPRQAQSGRTSTIATHEPRKLAQRTQPALRLPPPPSRGIPLGCFSSNYHPFDRIRCLHSSDALPFIGTNEAHKVKSTRLSTREVGRNCRVGNGTENSENSRHQINGTKLESKLETPKAKERTLGTLGTYSNWMFQETHFYLNSVTDWERLLGTQISNCRNERRTLARIVALLIPTFLSLFLQVRSGFVPFL
jgi:hypothetical protein